MSTRKNWITHVETDDIRAIHFGAFDPARDVVTDRLVLRSWTRTDIDAVRTGTRMPDWADDFPAEGDLVVAGLLPDNSGWSTAYGHRLIVERSTGLLVGSLGLFWPPSNGELEIGYGIVASRRGRGYAPEAVRALTEFAFTAPEVRAVTAEVEPSNPASVRVLEKCGFRHSTSLEQNLIQLRATRTDDGAAETSR